MNQENQKKAVILFIKYPEEGKVKTRLASTTSDKFAVNIYKAISENIFYELEKLKANVDVFVFYSPIDDIKKITTWVGKDFKYKVQIGNDLGEKISNAFEYTFSQNYSSSIIIGSDVPDITSIEIMNAFYILEKSDIVISPSDDGGYSLLGINEFYPELFQNIQWSSEYVLRETQKVIEKKKLKLSLLESLNDIDTEEELRSWLSLSIQSDLREIIKDLMEKEKII